MECKKELGYLDHRYAMERFGAELCQDHVSRLERLIKSHHTPAEAIMLYYRLKEAGVSAMLAWWDGKRTVDLAVSRAKLNIEIDCGFEGMTHDQALHGLEQSMHSFRNGFTTIRIPDFLVRNYLSETTSNILGIIEGLKANIKVV